MLLTSSANGELAILSESAQFVRTSTC